MGLVWAWVAIALWLPLVVSFGGLLWLYPLVVCPGGPKLLLARAGPSLEVAKVNVGQCFAEVAKVKVARGQVTMVKDGRCWLCQG